MPDYLYLLGHQAECAVIAAPRHVLEKTPITIDGEERQLLTARPFMPSCTCQPSVIEVRSGMAFDSETFTFVGKVIDG